MRWWPVLCHPFAVHPHRSLLDTQRTEPAFGTFRRLKWSNCSAATVRKLMRRDMLLSIRLKVPAPPVHDQPALLNELCLVDVSGADVVPLFVAHLPFNGGLGPQS